MKLFTNELNIFLQTRKKKLNRTIRRRKKKQQQQYNGGNLSLIMEIESGSEQKQSLWEVPL
jgi:hypothetical protein